MTSPFVAEVMRSQFNLCRTPLRAKRRSGEED
jgi:hypothetical protein